MKLVCLVVFSLIVLASGAALALSSPQIVAQASLLNQNSKIVGAPLFTPTTNGAYRVSAYLVVAAFQSQKVWALQINWIDDVQREQTPSGWLQAPSSAMLLNGQATTIVRAIAGQPITFNVWPMNQPKTSYDLFITVEQLESDQ
ncbi:MAG: hypothetical protein H0X25_04330 [Acidobacteriales bacterium]|nr:hypothetical protein [Terriglobales bacterium]